MPTWSVPRGYVGKFTSGGGRGGGQCQQCSCSSRQAWSADSWTRPSGSGSRTDSWTPCDCYGDGHGRSLSSQSTRTSCSHGHPYLNSMKAWMSGASKEGILPAWIWWLSSFFFCVLLFSLQELKIDYEFTCIKAVGDVPWKLGMCCTKAAAESILTCVLPVMYHRYMYILRAAAVLSA